jgi:hypothetical protein
MEIDKIKECFNIILNNYKKIDSNNKLSVDNIKKVDNVYQIYINSEQIDSVNYSVHINDIRHQVMITTIEHKYSCDVNQINTTKIYYDLFKLYNRLIKILLSIYTENKIMIKKIWGTNNLFVDESTKFKKLKTFIKTIAQKYSGVTDEITMLTCIKKYHYSTIKIHNELNENDKVNYESTELLFSEICNTLEELLLTTELIKINLSDIKNKISKGINGSAFMTDLLCKIDKIKSEYKYILNILNSILDIHKNLSNKYLLISNKILEDISYEDRKNKIENIIGKSKINKKTIALEDKKNKITVKKDNIIIREDSVSLKDDNNSLREDSVSLKEDNNSLREDTVILKEDSINLKEDNKSIREDTVSLKEDSISLKENNNSIKEDNNSLREETISFQEDNNSIKEDTLSLKENNNSIKNFSIKDDNISIKEDSNKNITVKDDTISIKENNSNKKDSVSLGSLNISVHENSMKNDSISFKDSISIRESSNNLSYKEDDI